MNVTKSRQLKIALCGIAAIGLFAATQGCSSSNSSGSGGSTGSGGTATGSGGSSTGAGGSSTGSGGSSTGAGGGGGVLGCASANTMTAPTSGLIADFMGDGSAGVEIMGGVSAYPGGASAPVATTTGTALHISENTAPMSMPQYVGTVVYFSGCVDASAFSGVQFSISGTMTGCTMQFSINDSEHGDSTAGVDPKTTGPKGSYAPQLGVATPFPASLMVPFTGTGAPMSGSPATLAIDPAKLIGLQWQFTIAPVAEGGAPTNCTADITIDDVKFYH